MKIFNAAIALTLALTSLVEGGSIKVTVLILGLQYTKRSALNS